MSDETHDFGISQPYYWVCPRLKCNKTIRAWTQKSFTLAKNSHLDLHFRDDKDQADKMMEQIRNAVYNRPSKAPEEYNKLICTWNDITFLISRGIRIDDDIEWEENGYRRKYSPPETDIPSVPPDKVR